MSDNNDPIDNNEALLKSLESIKALLAKSETKLSAARESLHQANQGTSMKKTESTPEIPTLDEIVEAGQQIEIGLPDEDDIPVLEAIEEEVPVFNLDTEENEDNESIMSMDAPSLSFAETEVSDEIPTLTTDFAMNEDESTTPMSLHEETVETTPAVELPNLTPILNAIDDAEGHIRAQISAAAIAFEEKLNSQLDVEMRKLREQVHALVEKFAE